MFLTIAFSLVVLVVIIIGVKIMASIADLTAAVAANTTAIQAAIAFIQANPPGQVPQELIDQLTAADAQLTAATTPVA